jgi:hypothetical protein
LYVSKRYSLQGQDGDVDISPFSAGNSVRCRFFTRLSNPPPAPRRWCPCSLHIQKLVEIVRARNKKRRRRRVGGAGDDFAVEMAGILDGRQDQGDSDL